MDVKVIKKQDERRRKINISFRDLNYSVCSGKEEKYILKNISGQFRGGQFSAILGPSGSGKTTLLNILAGYKITQASGLVCLNNQIRTLKYFHKISRYIMQENTLQPYLTVMDSMMIAADFKMNYRVTKQEKLQRVSKILNTLGLIKVQNTRTENLSGGERKRLAVAMELINNPSIIFLDEPTSGLDEQSSYQCLSTLKQLAEEGRTVICSIHSPSAKAFALFDHVYIITDGQCVYQGPGDQILPFLEKEQLTCPVYYNPIDFFIDVASGEYGHYSNNLVASTKNGKLCYPCETEMENCDSNIFQDNDLCFETIPDYYISTVSQLKVLLYRIFLQSYRNTTELKMKTLTYTIMLICFCLLFYNCGNDATKILANISLLFISPIALMYITLMPPLIHCPMEIKRIESEFFNRWYNIPAYFLAKTIAVIPSCVIWTTVYIGILFPMTGQPLEVNRISKFIAICVVVSLIADACSMAIASVFNVMNSFFLGISIMFPPVGLTVFGFGHPFHLHPYLIKVLLRTSFLRYALEAVMHIIYSDRPEHLHCPDSEVLCPVTSPKVIAHMFGYNSSNYWGCLGALVGFYVVCKCGHYFMLTQRLKPGKAAKIALHVVALAKRWFVKHL